MNFVHLLKLTISSILQSLHIYKLISLIWILFRQRELKCVGKENFLLVHQKVDKTHRKNTIHQIEWFNRAWAIACCCFLETFKEFYSILISTLNIRSKLNRRHVYSVRWFSDFFMTSADFWEKKTWSNSLLFTIKSLSFEHHNQVQSNEQL